MRARSGGSRILPSPSPHPQFSSHPSDTEYRDSAKHAERVLHVLVVFFSFQVQMGTKGAQRVVKVGGQAFDKVGVDRKAGSDLDLRHEKPLFYY